MCIFCRSKKEDDERRKAEDKARRDAIFEKYIKRKMAVEGNIESDSPPPAAMNQPVRSTPPVSHVMVRRRASAGRTPGARPTSQPPSTHWIGIGTPAGELVSHGSDENLTDGSQPSSTLHSNWRF